MTSRPESMLGGLKSGSGGGGAAGNGGAAEKLGAASDQDEGDRKVDDEGVEFAGSDPDAAFGRVGEGAARRCKKGEGGGSDGAAAWEGGAAIAPGEHHPPD